MKRFGVGTEDLMDSVNAPFVMLQSELDISRNLVNLYNFGRKCHENEPQEIFS